MKELLREDRGLGTAYERHCLYQLMDAWAKEFGVESLLEGPVDGMAGVAGVHGVGLAIRGVRVVSAVPTEEHAEVVRAIYASCNAAVNVVVAGETDLATLPPSDMVICYHALSFVSDWQNYLANISKLAKKVLIVAVCNPDNWGVTAMKYLARFNACLQTVASDTRSRLFSRSAQRVLDGEQSEPRVGWGPRKTAPHSRSECTCEGRGGAARAAPGWLDEHAPQEKTKRSWRAAGSMGPPPEWYTQNLAPELWRIGRVKHHTYFDCPWWPDLPAFDRADAYAGRSVKGRLKKMLTRSKTSDAAASKFADKFVYGPDRWPYFGGPGWRDELMPALLRHPCFEGTTGILQRRTAHLHAFVVDVRPRTPQKRRRLATVQVP